MWGIAVSAPQEYETPVDYSTANGVYCAYCGATPAARVDIRGHRGFLIMMQFLKQPGPFCRDCGIATYRRMTIESAWIGWWGFASFVINPITMLINLAARAQIGRLAAPLPGSHYQPMDPGKPLYLRPGLLGLLIPVLVIGGLIAAANNDTGTSRSRSSDCTSVSCPRPGSYSMAPTPPAAVPPVPAAPINSVKEASVGDCVRNQKNIPLADDKHPTLTVVACTDPAAEAKVIHRVGNVIPGESGLFCDRFPEADLYYTMKWTNAYSPIPTGYTLCMQTLR
ncbi:hypothetical protein [Nocardia sp. NPDC052566]|uniref:LppU/SCO3897 family protein n=1 Tax=Nocardia sp. NPDC052566 TaxID=3364330 RepID=UPI0037C641D6